MNFALFSSGISTVAAEQISQIINKQIGHIKFAVITTAATPYIEKNLGLFPDWLNDDIGHIKAHGFQTAFFRLEDLTPTIEEEIKKYDVIYFAGGNVFYLRYLIETANASSLISYFSKNKLYAGSSAGSIVVTKDLQPYALLDNPKDAPELITEGLGLIDSHILVHWNSASYHKELKTIADKYKKDINTKIFYIEDGQVLFLNFGEFRQI